MNCNWITVRNASWFSSAVCLTCDRKVSSIELLPADCLIRDLQEENNRLRQRLEVAQDIVIEDATDNWRDHLIPHEEQEGARDGIRTRNDVIRMLDGRVEAAYTRLESVVGAVRGAIARLETGDQNGAADILRTAIDD